MFECRFRLKECRADKQHAIFDIASLKKKSPLCRCHPQFQRAFRSSIVDHKVGAEYQHCSGCLDSLGAVIYDNRTLRSIQHERYRRYKLTRVALIRAEFTYEETVQQLILNWKRLFCELLYQAERNHKNIIISWERGRWQPGEHMTWVSESDVSWLYREGLILH